MYIHVRIQETLKKYSLYSLWIMCTIFLVLCMHVLYMYCTCVLYIHVYMCTHQLIVVFFVVFVFELAKLLRLFTLVLLSINYPVIICT